MTSNMYYFIMTASGMEIGHRFRQHVKRSLAFDATPQKVPLKVP